MENRGLLMLLMLLLVNAADCSDIHFVPLGQNGKTFGLL